MPSLYSRNGQARALEERLAQEKKADELRRERDQAEAKLEVLDAEVTRLSEQHASDLVEIGKQAILRSQLERRHETLKTRVRALIDI